MIGADTDGSYNKASFECRPKVNENAPAAIITDGEVAFEKFTVKSNTYYARIIEALH